MTTTSDARKRLAEATATPTTTPDAATVAAVLWSHRAVVSGDDDGWHVVCQCGHNELGNDPYPHVTAALLAAPPIAQALAAVEAVARVEALADEWQRKATRGEYVSADDMLLARQASDLRAALRPSAGA